jgi:hypothetical protein
MRMASAATALCLAAGLAVGAWGVGFAEAQVEVIYSTVAGANSVPPDRATGTNFGSFSRPFFSPDGNRWILRCTDTGSATTNSFIMKGAGTLGTTLIRRGGAAPWAGGSEVAGLFDDNPGITNTGLSAFGNNLDGTTTIDEFIVKHDAGLFTALAKEGDAAPSPMGFSYGTVSRSIAVANDGRVGFISTITDGATTPSAAYFGAVRVVQTADSLFAPTNQSGGNTFPWKSFFNERFHVKPSGNAWLLFGALDDGSTSGNDTLVLNNGVVLQEGATFPGTVPDGPVNIVVIDLPLIDVAGNWWASGQNAADMMGVVRHFIVRNGETFVLTGDPITTGSSEHFARPGGTLTFSAFQAFGENNRGDTVVSGLTDSATLNANTVLVVNGSTELARENDSFTLPGGTVAFFGQTESTANRYTTVFSDVTITETHVYAVARLRNAAGTSIGSAFVRWPIPGVSCVADFDRNHVVDADDLFAFLDAWFAQNGQSEPARLSADVNNTEAVDADDLFDFLDAWFAANGGPC